MYEKLMELLRLLLTKTKARKVEWEVFPDEEMVRVRIATGFLRIGREQGQLLESADGRVLENPIVYLLWVIDSRGRVSDEFIVTPLEERNYALVAELFAAAKAAARSTDHVLQEMIDSLK